MLALDEIVMLADQLSPQDRLRLLEHLAAGVRQDLETRQETARRSLKGLWADVSVSAEDIDEARREMWANFPREDI